MSLHNRLTSRSLLILAVLFAGGLTGCKQSSAFNQTEVIVVNATGTSFSGEQVVDLSTIGVAWSHRSKVTSLSIESIEATIVSLEAGNAATTGSGTLALRADGAPADGSQDVAVGSLTNAAIAPGTAYVVQGVAQVSTLLYDALKGSGKFTTIATGSANASPVRFTVDITIHAKVSYTLP
jgi:hypothetical protein